ncbi:MAG: hypothetical protein ACJ8D0_03105, partial [Xanthobacteraceae bacterium]
ILAGLGRSLIRTRPPTAPYLFDALQEGAEPSVATAVAGEHEARPPLMVHVAALWDRVVHLSLLIGVELHTIAALRAVVTGPARRIKSVD